MEKSISLQTLGRMMGIEVIDMSNPENNQPAKIERRPGTFGAMNSAEITRWLQAFGALVENEYNEDQAAIIMDRLTPWDFDPWLEENQVSPADWLNGHYDAIADEITEE